MTLTRPGGLIGSTRWAGGQFHRESAIDGAPPQIGFPPHQILSLYHPSSQNSGLEAQNGLEATSYQNWRQMAPLPNWLLLTLQDLFPTTTSWTNPLKLVLLTTCYQALTGGWGCNTYNFTTSHKMQTELY